MRQSCSPLVSSFEHKLPLRPGRHSPDKLFFAARETNPVHRSRTSVFPFERDAIFPSCFAHLYSLPPRPLRSIPRWTVARKGFQPTKLLRLYKCNYPETSLIHRKDCTLKKVDLSSRRSSTSSLTGLEHPLPPRSPR